MTTLLHHVLFHKLLVILVYYELWIGFVWQISNLMNFTEILIWINWKQHNVADLNQLQLR